MTRQERLREIGRQLYEAKVTSKDADSYTKELRDEFFRLYDEEFKGKDHLLPVRTIEVPDVFWQSTQMSKEDFVVTRFPGWNVEHVEYNTAKKMSTFILKRDPIFVPGMIDIPDGEKILRVSKEVSEYTPEMDWESLRQERPDLFEKLAQPVTQYEIDEEAFEQMVNETPEELATIQRHMRVKPPVLRATAKRVKNDG